jgi:hypothetical protein
MKTFTYDEVVEIMSECLNHLDEQVDTDKCVQIETYDVKIDFENHVSIVDATYDLDDLYNEISREFRERLDNLASYKKSLTINK